MGEAHNPFCGDTVRIWVREKAGRIAEISFDGQGCSLSQAAASMLTALMRGAETGSVAELRHAFTSGLAPDTNSNDLPKKLGDLRALVGVGRFPNRLRCAVLPFDALEEALGRSEE